MAFSAVTKTVKPKVRVARCRKLLGNFSAMQLLFAGTTATVYTDCNVCGLSSGRCLNLVCVCQVSMLSIARDCNLTHDDCDWFGLQT